LGKAKHDKIIETLRQFEIPKPKKPLSYQDLWTAMRRDKKAIAGKVKMVLLSENGKPLVAQSVASSDVMLALIEMSEEGLLSIK
jgi:3-dehydroquinate synthetase